VDLVVGGKRHFMTTWSPKLVYFFPQPHVRPVLDSITVVSVIQSRLYLILIALCWITTGFKRFSKTVTLKMQIAMFTETLENFHHYSCCIPECQSHARL
jgi:hypothetical protein